jgi:RNA polymerase sigma-32 factor
MVDVTKMFLNEITKDRYKPFTREKELEILKMKDNMYFRNKLIEANIRFLYKVAKEYSQDNAKAVELVSEAAIGLVEAIKRYDINSNMRILSYAIHWIKGFVKFNIIRKNNADKCRKLYAHANPSNDNAKFIRIGKNTAGMDTDHRIEQNANGSVSHWEKCAEISDKIRHNGSDIQFIRLDRNLDGKDCVDMSMYDIVKNENSEPPDENAITSERKAAIRKLLDKLSPMDRHILLMRYGFIGVGKITLGGIAAMYGVSKEWIRVREKKALESLRHSRAARELANE